MCWIRPTFEFMKATRKNYNYSPFMGILIVVVSEADQGRNKNVGFTPSLRPREMYSSVFFLFLGKKLYDEIALQEALRGVGWGPNTQNFPWIASMARTSGLLGHKLVL